MCWWLCSRKQAKSGGQYWILCETVVAVFAGSARCLSKEDDVTSPNEADVSESMKPANQTSQQNTNWKNSKLKQRTQLKAIDADSLITSPNCPGRINFPEPFIKLDSTTIVFPPTSVHTKPTATPGI